MSDIGLLLILAFSTLAQLAAAWLALRQMAGVSGPYRFAWGYISLALALMVQRRIAPLWRMISGSEPANSADAWFGLAISLFMLIGIFGIRRLFIDMKRQEIELDTLARTDALTQLPNRREIMELLQTEIERSERSRHPVAIMMLDIDHFKTINDTWGHAAGDRVLKAIADTARASLRRIDSCGRIGGEEFLVLLPETDRTEAAAAAERLRAAIAGKPIENDGQSVRVSVSIGVAIRHEEDSPASPDPFIQLADRALYMAKESGRNRVVMA